MTASHADAFGIGGPTPTFVDLPGERCLALRVDVTQQFVGQAPGGYRLDLFFSGDSDGPSGHRRPPLECARPSVFPSELQRAIDTGNILSGNDWLTVNTRGVLDFDSRITINLGIDGAKCPISGRLRGRAQLSDVLKPNGTRYFDDDADVLDVLSVWQEGFADRSTLPLVLSAAFDIPNVGFGERQTRLYKQARDLGRTLFIALGSAVFRKARYGAIESLDLELYTLRKPAPQSSRGGTT